MTITILAPPAGPTAALVGTARAHELARLAFLDAWCDERWEALKAQGAPATECADAHHQVRLTWDRVDSEYARLIAGGAL